MRSYGSENEQTGGMTRAAVALTHISAYSTHKNLAVYKIMEAMRTAYAKSGIQSQHVSNYTWGKQSRKARKYREMEARVVCEHFNISLNRLMVVKVLLKCAIRFPLFRRYAFQCTQIFRSLLLKSKRGRCQGVKSTHSMRPHSGPLLSYVGQSGHTWCSRVSWDVRLAAAFSASRPPI